MELHFTPQRSLQDQSRPDQDFDNAQALRAERLARTESKDTDMVLTTKEGDVVTLSKSSDLKTELATYSTFQQNGNTKTTTSGYSQSLEFSSAYEVSVEGDLSKQELKDINKAIRRLDKAMNHLSNGNSERALKKAMSIGNLGTVAGFEASLTYQASQEYEYVQQSSVERLAQPVEEPAGLTDEGKSLLEMMTDELVETINQQKEIPKEEVLPPVNQLFEDIQAKMAEQFEKAQKQENPWEEFLSNLQDRFLSGLF